MSRLGDFISRTFKTSPKNIPSSSATMAYQDRGRVAKANVALFRNWAEHSEWIRAAINIRKTQISSADWGIVPFDQTKPFDTALAAKVKQVFDTPNPRADSFRSFIEPIVEDILVLDAGVIEKVRNLRAAPAELWGVDGGKIRVSAIWDGDPDEPRYFWYPDNQERARFRSQDMIYIMANPRTYSVVGLSPLETLKLTIDAEISGHEYNRKQVTSAAPDGMIDLGEGVRPDQVEAFKSYWLTEVAGKGAMAFLGGTKNPKFIPFRESNKDMQFLEWQIYLVRKIAAVFGLSPQDLGVTFDINRSTAETLQENTEDRGLRPLLALIQEYLTREVVWDTGFGGSANNLAFRFTRLNLKESTSKAQINKMALAGVPWKTVDEARIEDGREPFGAPFDRLIMVTPQGAVLLDEIPTAEDVMTGPSPQAGNPPANDRKAPAGPGPRR